MAMVESSVAMMTSQQPRSAVLPAKQRPEVRPTLGTQPDSFDLGFFEQTARQGLGVFVGH